MEIFKLKNRMKVVFSKRKNDSVVVQATVKVGSNNETERISGISHFIEHMLFEGTRRRMDARMITGEIENVGGEINAYTSNEKTCFYVRVPKKYFSKALDTLSDILLHPLFDKKKISKERKVILKEINLHKDEPRLYQWVLFQKTLFQKTGVKNPTYGTVRAVRTISKEDLISFYDEHYSASNIVISVVGDVDNVGAKMEKYFGNFKSKEKKEPAKQQEPTMKKVAVKKVRRRILSAYMVMGFKSVPRIHKDSYVLDVIKAILGRGQSGRINDEIRNKRGLAYEVGILHDCGINYGFFAFYLNTNKKNIARIKRIILKEIDKLDKIKEGEIADAKGYLSGNFIIENEDNRERADQLGFWEYAKDARMFSDYCSNIRKVQIQDIKRVAKRYFFSAYALAIIEPI